MQTAHDTNAAAAAAATTPPQQHDDGSRRRRRRRKEGDHLERVIGGVEVRCRRVEMQLHAVVVGLRVEVERVQRAADLQLAAGVERRDRLGGGEC